MEELFKPGRLQLFFHTLPFGSVVLSQSRGQTAPPLTQRVATLSPEAPAPVPIARMTVGSRRELDHLVVVSFVPADDKNRPKLYLNWGATMSRIDLATILLGHKKVHMQMEACFDVTVQKRDQRFPLYHASTNDMRCFFVLTISPDESAWEVKQVDVLLHRLELQQMSGNDKVSELIPQLDFVAFYRSWGQRTPVHPWGSLTSVDGEFLIAHEPDDDDDLDDNGMLPPTSGVLATCIGGQPFAAFYTRTGNVLTATKMEQSQVSMQSYDPAKPPADFGRRLQTLMFLTIDFASKKISVQKKVRQIN